LEAFHFGLSEINRADAFNGNGCSFDERRHPSYIVLACVVDQTNEWVGWCLNLSVAFMSNRLDGFLLNLKI